MDSVRQLLEIAATLGVVALIVWGVDRLFLWFATRRSDETDEHHEREERVREWLNEHRIDRKDDEK